MSRTNVVAQGLSQVLDALLLLLSLGFIHQLEQDEALQGRRLNAWLGTQEPPGPIQPTPGFLGKA